MRLRSVFFVALIAASAGCSASESPAGLEQFRGIAPSDMDCTMSTERCAVIQAGIDYLKAHANSECRAYGTDAQNRFDSVSGDGFRDRAQWGILNMGVETVSPTNPAPADGYTNVYPAFWTSGNTNPQSTGSLIAHEEGHHLMLSEAQAQQRQDVCMNPQG
jgi:hypothetical protein